VVLSACLLPVAQAAYLQSDTPLVHPRFGIGVGSQGDNRLAQFDYQQLHLSWFFDWGSSMEGPEPGVKFVPLVAGYNVGPVTQSEIQTQLDNHPDWYPDGTVWMVGNEIGMDDSRGPTQYAIDYHDSYINIKAVDPDFLVSNGAVLPGSKLHKDDSLTSASLYGVEFLQQAADSYFTLYSEPMPIDVYCFHGYTTADWTSVDLFKQAVRDLRQFMKDRGDQNKAAFIKGYGNLDYALLTFSPNNDFSNWPAGANDFDKPLAKVEPLYKDVWYKIGDNFLAVDNADEIGVGDYVLLKQGHGADRSFMKHLYFELEPTVYPTADWPYLWPVKVTGKRETDGGQTLLMLAQPLRLNIRPEWNPTLYKYNFIQECGVESLSIHMPDIMAAVHIQEVGFNAIKFQAALNCWVDRVHIYNADAALQFDKDSKHCQAENIEIHRQKNRRRIKSPYKDWNTHYDGHYGITFGGSTHDCLAQNIVFNVKHTHDISLSFFSSGNVVRKVNAEDIVIDHHRMGPFANLYCDINAGKGTLFPPQPWSNGHRVPRAIMSTGTDAGGAHAGRATTFWNLHSETWGKLPLAHFAETGGMFPGLNIIPCQQNQTAMTGHIFCENIDAVYPEDLYLEQKKIRFMRSNSTPATFSVPGTIRPCAASLKGPKAFGNYDKMQLFSTLEQNQVLAYPIYSAGQSQKTMTVWVRNFYGTPAPDYHFELGVYVDKDYKGTLRIPARSFPSQRASMALGDCYGTRTLTLKWPNALNPNQAGMASLEVTGITIN